MERLRLEHSRILVTGGTGFIGSRLVEKLVLEHQARVRVLVRDFHRISRLASLPVEITHGDITDRTSLEAAVRGCDILFHCAYDFRGNREAQKKCGVSGTENVCEAALGQVRRLVHVSTFAVYGPAVDGRLVENSPWQPSADAYVAVKREAEQAVLNCYKNGGLPAAIVQPTLVYGPFSDHWTVKPAERLRTHRVPLVDGGHGFCNLVYIDDVVDGLILAAARPGIEGERFLISGEEPVTWREFFDYFERALGVRSTIDLSREEIERLAGAARAAAGNLELLKGWVRDPKVRDELARLPMARGFLRLARRFVPDSHWTALMGRILGSGSRSRVTSPVRSHDKPIYIPDPAQVAMHAARGSVGIDKARRVLGYEPAFDFHRGMRLAIRYLFWANVVPGGLGAFDRTMARPPEDDPAVTRFAEMGS